MESLYIRRFDELNAGDVTIAGGKGASLAELVHAEMPVPAGFVILTEAFEQFLDAADLRSEIELALQDLDVHNQVEIEPVSAYLYEQILRTPLSEGLEAEIQRSYAALATHYVAVRSSAVGEDGSEAAWAGQLESYLNTTTETLIDHVKSCWASLFSTRAIVYRLQQQMRPKEIAVAVVVQKMVVSDVSGIAFSTHPITKSKNHLVIEAGYGLGEAIVSGQIIPETYVVQKEMGTIQEMSRHQQEKGLYRASEGGNEWRDLSSLQKEERVLSDEDVTHLSQFVIRIESYFGFPVDVEWAKEGDQFFILQSRPITTL